MSPWTEEKLNEVATGLVAGWSASQIGGKLGVTRNAVIGVVGRNKMLKAIGFKNKSPSQGTPRKSRVPKSTSQKPAVLKPTWTFVDGLSLQLAGRPLHTVMSNECRYAVNNAGMDEVHLFCGAPADGSWCPVHRSIVYRPRERAAN